MIVLERADWQARAEAHASAVEAELADVVARRDRGVKHPVDDFLFHYYTLRPSQLAQWHPGAGVALADAAEYARAGRYRVLPSGAVTLDVDAFLAQRGGTVRTALDLLTAAEAAPARFGCFGMHEWAMVYRLRPDESRHPYLPLRYPPAEIARIVEEVGCRCTHIDAFRFFTPAAKPLNLLHPTRERQAEFDQPGCLHVNMDLYKWAGKLTPAVSSDLVFATFRLARDIRAVDMQASAYDLTGWGYEPIPVETAAGRADYVARQRVFTERAAPLRRALIDSLTALCNRERVPGRSGSEETGVLRTGAAPPPA